MNSCTRIVPNAVPPYGLDELTSRGNDPVFRPR
jgi:hypothetical protein